MLLSNTDINNFVSFGVVSPDGVTDVLITYHCIPQITLTVNDRLTFRISGKGVPVDE